MSIFTKEPSVVTGFVAAVLALLVAYGVTVTDAQNAAIMGIAAAIIALVQAFVTRSQVIPTKEAEAIISETETKAFNDGLYTTVPTEG